MRGETIARWHNAKAVRAVSDPARKDIHPPNQEFASTPRRDIHRRSRQPPSREDVPGKHRKYASETTVMRRSCVCDAVKAVPVNCLKNFIRISPMRGLSRDKRAQVRDVSRMGEGRSGDASLTKQRCVHKLHRAKSIDSYSIPTIMIKSIIRIRMSLSRKNNSKSYRLLLHNSLE